MEDIAAAYTNIVIPEETPKVQKRTKGLLSSTRNINMDKKTNAEEPLDRVQRYVAEIRKKRMETKNG